MQTKKKAAENVFKSATTAAEEVMSANVGSTEPCSSLPKTTSIARAANRHRSKNSGSAPPPGRLYYLVSLPSAGADQQRRGGLVFSTERQGKSFATLHSRLSEYWDEYVAGTR